MIRKIGTLGQFGGPILVDRIITNSKTLRVSDAVKTVAGFIDAATSSGSILGHIESFVGNDELTPIKDGTFKGNLHDSFISSATNQTVEKVSARIDIDVRSLYQADGSGPFGTTTGSNLTGKTFKLSNAYTIDETSVTTTKLQYVSHGLDRNDTSKIVVNILNSEIFGM